MKWRPHPTAFPFDMIPKSLHRAPDGLAGLPLAMVVVFASSAFVQKHAGVPWLLVYLPVVMAVFGLARYSSMRLPARWSPWLMVAFFLALLAAFLVLYPIEHGKGFGRSSDRDDALNLAVARILDGESPYYPQSDRAGPLSLFPGAILLAMPFSVAGNSAWQNFLWLPVFLALTARLWQNKEAALVWFVTLVGVSPAIQYEFISGGDMLANSIYIPCAALFLLTVCRSPGNPAWLAVAAAAFFGLALTSRPNFVFVLPLVLAGIVSLRGWKGALMLAVVAIATACVLTMPLYLQDPAGFTPLPTGNKLSSLDSVLPHASRWLALATAVATGFGIHDILRRPCCGWIRIWRWCSVVLLVPMVGAVLLQSFSRGQPDFGFLHDRYGLMPMFFAFWGWAGVPLRETPPDMARETNT